jgi:hypothetical protein
VRAIIRDTSGACLDIYVPTPLLLTCLEAEHEAVRGPLEILPLGLERDPLIASLGDLIAAEILRGGAASRVAPDSATSLLAVPLIRRWSNQAGRARLPASGLAPWQTRRATEYIRQHLHEDVSLAELASVVRLTDVPSVTPTVTHVPLRRSMVSAADTADPPTESRMKSYGPWARAASRVSPTITPPVLARSTSGCCSSRRT